MRHDLDNAFRALSFAVVEGPEISSADLEFDRPNFPADHPARESMDTYWLAGGRCPHLTGASVRYLSTHEPPIRIAYPGRVYRNESTDTRHERAFFQYEVLVVDKTGPARHRPVPRRCHSRHGVRRTSAHADAARPDAVPQLTRTGRQVRATAAQALSTVAQAAVTILGGPDADLLKECGRPECTQVYLDHSRGSRREWCAMATCGNKMKAAAYRARQRGNPPLTPSRQS
ncbi:CGNR zinc finger domain-containing protein [Amycolatopsis rubida]|nr:CGNR zinc finger domain-containing protein [Amycolatopsis rubida]